MSERENLPYWAVNVPEDKRPSSCPEFLMDAGEKDRLILSTPDEQYRRLSWSEVREFIRSNRIDLFQRVPSDLRRYLDYAHSIKRQYGSVMEFVIKERLGWEDARPSAPPFDNSDDIKILYNDWPYGIDEGIVHLVVWTKFDLQDDPVTDDLTPEACHQVDAYVQKTFCQSVPPENVIFFRNWRSLKSIHAVEHFHVMLYKPEVQSVENITKGDVPLSRRLGTGGVA